jgi:hypothetical protein
MYILMIPHWKCIIHNILIYYSARQGVPKVGGLRYEYAGPERRTERQATQHGCLPRLLGDGDKGIEKVYGEEKIIL